jgi:2-dehydro-3-deoxy-D-arabinonate dehydratase
VIVTADDIPDPYHLQMTCTITRAGKALYHGEVNTAKLHRRLETLVEFLTRANNVPTGTVLLTGTGIIVTQEAALALATRLVSRCRRSAILRIRLRSSVSHVA